MNEDRLRAAYGAALENNAVRIGGHPSPEAIAALARREGTERERLTTLDHVMGCKECRAEFDLLRAVERAGAQTGAGRAGARRAWFVPAALAASLLLAVGVGRLVMNQGQEVLTRGGEAGAVVLLHPDLVAASGDSLVFVWRPAPRSPQIRPRGARRRRQRRGVGRDGRHQRRSRGDRQPATGRVQVVGACHDHRRKYPALPYTTPPAHRPIALSVLSHSSFANASSSASGLQRASRHFT